jgi:hypothetical protein
MSLKRRVSAKVEFLANKEDLKKLLAQGYSVKAAHDILREQGKMTNMKYSTLLKYIKRGVKVKQLQEERHMEPVNKANKALLSFGSAVERQNHVNNQPDIRKNDAVVARSAKEPFAHANAPYKEDEEQ